MIVGSMSERPLEDYDTHEARVQSLSSGLERYFSDDVPVNEIIKLAHFVIFDLPDLQKKGMIEFCRKEFDLLCTVRSIPKMNLLFFFPKGTFLPKDQKAAYGVCRTVKTAFCLLPSQELIRVKKVVPQKMSQEFRHHLEMDGCIFFDPGLKDAKGIPKTYALFSYRWQHLAREKKHLFLSEKLCAIMEDRPPTREKLCLMMEHFDGGLHNLLIRLGKNEIPHLSFRERANIILQMVCAVHTLHTHVNEDGTPDPIGHYDIKPANFLFRIGRTEKGGRKFSIAICDFGLHCHVRETPDEDDIRQWYIHQNHLYPCVEATAPELLQEKIVHDDLLKADIWALGCACLQLFVSQDVTYVYQMLNQVGDNDTKETLAERLEIARKAVLERRQQLIERAQLFYAQDRPLIGIVERMLEPDPSCRPSIEVVKRETERVVIDYGAH